MGYDCVLAKSWDIVPEEKVYTIKNKRVSTITFKKCKAGDLLCGGSFLCEGERYIRTESIWRVVRTKEDRSEIKSIQQEEIAREGFSLSLAIIVQDCKKIYFGCNKTPLWCII